MPNTTAQTVAEYFAALRAMDVDRFVNAFAPDAVSHDPVGTPAHHGHDAIRAFFTGVASLFETFGLTENHVFIIGNSAAVKWTGNGIGRNGKTITFEGIDVLEVNPEGKISEVHAYSDPAPVMASLQS